MKLMKVETIKKTIKSPLIYVIIINLIVRYLYYYVTVPYVIAPDTYGYVEFSFRKFIQLDFSNGRPPLYPTIIRICEILAGEGDYFKLVVGIQILISIISVVLFYKSLELIINKKSLVWIFTILYSCSNAIIGWDKVILTESLSLSGTVLFIYLLFLYLIKPSKKLAIWIPIYTLILIQLRPTFLLYMIIIFVFFIIKYFVDRNNKVINIRAIVSCIVCFIVIIVYSYIFSFSHGIFSISNTKVRQDLYVSIYQGYYKDSSDKEYVNFVDKTINEIDGDWEAMITVLNKYGNKKISQYTKECKLKNISDYSKYILSIFNSHYNIYFAGNNHFREHPGFLNDPIYDLGKLATDTFMQIKFYHVYLVMLVELVLVIRGFIKYKMLDWIHGGLLSFTTGIILTSFIGTNAEFMRTAICVIPFVYIAICIYMDRFISKSAT